MASDQLKVEPPATTFNPPLNAARSSHTLTNSGPSRLTYKVKCTHPDLILANPVFGVMDAGKNVKLNLHGRFNNPPDLKAAYRVYIQYAETPADMAPGDDQAKIRQGWSAVKDPKTYKLVVGFNQPPPTGGAPPSPARGTPAEPPVTDAVPPAEAPPE